MNKLSLSSIGALLVLGMILEGCSGVKRTLGLDRHSPDEFAVTPSEAPLDMPPDFRVLPTPQPGAARPQDMSTSEKVLKGLTGKAAPRTPGMSQGESALLNMAGAAPGQDSIRTEIDTESRIEDMDETLLERLRVKEKKRGSALKAYEEAEELQKKGIPTSPYTPKTPGS
ncbi:DUF3035 domain-containing protein [Candidatus Bealeia paramacronuclearis]|uniref:DUF3035 domain-containing protein n=1 Tax=Candidatus Bealeia paramacronuclearis TaxID=1921001 RepID=A0ABZ2C2I7_9PROT|nr:hypothetical protein [Candidatus Bealeia paramacronuclearis]